MCVGKPRAHPWVQEHLCLAQIILERWYFLGIYLALCLVFCIPLLREHKHFSSVTGKLTPRFFVDVCPWCMPGPRCSDAVQLNRPFKGKHQIVLFLLAHFLRFFALSYFLMINFITEQNIKFIFCLSECLQCLRQPV